MKRALLFVVAAITGGVIATLYVSGKLNSRHATELAVLEAARQQDQAALEAALNDARSVERVVKTPMARMMPAAASPLRLTPAELVARLGALKFHDGPGQSRAVRQAIHDFEDLLAAGPAALPAIRQFLERNEDMDLGASQGKVGRAGVAQDFVVPPSLRFGMYDVVKRIGGTDAELLLASALGATGRGVELAWLARALQEMAPGKYRETALASAHELLSRPTLAKLSSPLDANDREHLFSVLAMYGDTSFVSVAQGQLVQPDGAVDRSALRYLQQSLGPQAVAVAAQAYQSPLLLTNAAAKEPLARLALNFAGTDVQADEFYQQAINDPILTKSHRKNLIEDLNQDGFSDTKNLTGRDLPLIQSRINLIEQLAPSATDPVNAAAFKEAYKDLINMRDRVLRPPDSPR